MKRALYWISIAVCLLLSVVSVVLHFFPYSGKPTANVVYNNCLYNVVEVKAESEQIGESLIRFTIIQVPAHTRLPKVLAAD